MRGNKGKGDDWAMSSVIIVTLAVSATVFEILTFKAINKKAQLMLAYPRDAKFLHFEVITSSSQVGNPVFIVLKFLIQITSMYNS